MSGQTIEQANKGNLRLRAFARLTGRRDPGDAWTTIATALEALYKLASSPSTAADSLALLHELQVHQVELDLQDEELRHARVELELALTRQIQLYDFAPVGCFTVDRDTALCELNLTGARLLGFERDALLGRNLDGFLAPDSSRALHAMLARIGEGKRGEVCELQLMTHDGVRHSVHASANADPAGGHFLVAFVSGGKHGDVTAI